MKVDLGETSTSDDDVPPVMVENTSTSIPVQDPYAGTVELGSGISGGSLNRSVAMAPTATTPSIGPSVCPAGAHCVRPR